MIKNKQKTYPEEKIEDLVLSDEELMSLETDDILECPQMDFTDFIVQYGDTPVGEDEPAGDISMALAGAGVELLSVEGKSWMDEASGSRQSTLDADIMDDFGFEEDPDKKQAHSNLNEVDAFLDDDWFEDDDELTSFDDCGEDGPIEDHFEIDANYVDKLPKDDPEEAESIQSVMDNLGISLPEEPDGFEQRGHEGNQVVLEEAFLGPQNATPLAIAVSEGQPILVGNGVFRIGADGMFHQLPIDLDIAVTSISIWEGSVYLGTKGHGVFKYSLLTGSLLPMNGWNSLGLNAGTTSASIATSFYVSGAMINNQYVLFGRTHGGQLYFSVNATNHWQGPITPGRCIGVAIDKCKGRVYTLLSTPNGVSLKVSDDMEKWTQVSLPTALAREKSRGSCKIVAQGNTIGIGWDSGSQPFWMTVDGGETWTVHPGFKEVSAVAIHDDDPLILAIAVCFEENELCVIRITLDGGRTWKTCMMAGRESLPHGALPDGRGGKVSDLVFVPGLQTKLYIVAGEGVHELILSSQGKIKAH